jgi:predicted AAA+ superfamily ATPase
MFIRGEVESFPGRRGKGGDAIFHPLSFREFLKVMNPDIYSSLEVIKGLNPAEIWEKCTRARPWLDEVNRAFESYLECGGSRCLSHKFSAFDIITLERGEKL